MPSAAYCRKNAAWRDLMIRLGIQPPDTPFNRRAAAYAKAAAAWARKRDRDLMLRSQQAQNQDPGRGAERKDDRGEQCRNPARKSHREVRHPSSRSSNIPPP